MFWPARDWCWIIESRGFLFCASAMNTTSDHLISPATLLRALLVCIGLLVLAEVLRQIANYGFGRDYLWGIAPYVRMYGENEVSLPNWYSTVQLALASLVCFAVYLDRRKYAAGHLGHWLGLGGIMLYISLDEATRLHERTIQPLQETFDLGGYLTYAWVIPGAVAVLVVGLAYLAFLRALPARTARLMFASGVLFVTGALGLEFFEGALADQGRADSFVYGVLAVTEEIAEMIAIAVFIFAVTDYAARHCRGCAAIFGDPPKTQSER